MRRLVLGCALAMLSQSTCLAQSISVKDNSDFSLTLSQGNYNRVFIRGDEIWDFAYPPGAMGLKRDKGDGSIYLMPATSNPFTLFLTTKAGLHFTVTVNGEESLGKTIEFIPQQVGVAKNAINKAQNNTPTLAQEVIPEAILAMLTHMEQQKPFADVSVSRQFGKVERWSKGLTLLPKESWDGKRLKGETIELYNGGKEPLQLAQEWFAKEGTLAIKFSKPVINPKERAMLYRVQGINHG